MNSDEHNKAPIPSNGKPIMTFADLHAFIAASDLASGPKGLILSSLRVTDRLIGNGSLDTIAAPEVVMRLLRAWTPAMAGMTT